ncbi:nucleotidyltransferase [Candidatus Curtissbacteria bacterium RBG_13_35_7]|uniref:Nucleotidyltransferase n=1 Tax=Candidatus Curtissbacteria bacterium RBG_13_35_7 TaxID=1797705 RepID=A0A1F5G645_9BACT|nr:MAG: nucleotidyltransferase [Candidatus Curtissbacteria bacterium RBG_13_35_7]
MTKLEAVFVQYSKAVFRFKDVLAQDKNEFIRDSAIQRFEFTFDLSWKLIKAYLEEESGIICNSPKECFRQAYKQKLIEYDDFWIEMTDMRNQTAHTYHEQTAEKIYKQLPKTLKMFKVLEEKLKK